MKSKDDVISSITFTYFAVLVKKLFTLIALNTPIINAKVENDLLFFLLKPLLSVFYPYIISRVGFSWAL